MLIRISPKLKQPELPVQNQHKCVIIKHAYVFFEDFSKNRDNNNNKLINDNNILL